MGSLNFSHGMTPIERVTQGVPVIDTNHWQIHAANAFSVINTMTVANGQTGVIQISVPAATYVHFQAADISSSAGPATVSIFEDAAMTSEVGAATLVPVNRHRITATASALTVKALANAGVTNGASVVELAKLALHGTGVGATKLSAEVSNVQEWILKPSETYVIALPNAGVVGGIVFGYNLFWYEESGA